MILLRAARAWVISVLACALLLAALIIVQGAWWGRLAQAPANAVDIALAFGAVFAAVAATLHLPVFLILSITAASRLTRGVAALIGAALAPVVYLGVAMAFRESEGPQTALAWTRYWAQNPAAFLGGVVPFAIAGAIFGLAWVWRGAPVTRPPSA